MNPMEDIAKGIENLEKQVGQVTKHFELSDKDQSFIKEQMSQIAKAFDRSNTPQETLDMLAKQAEKVMGDPKQLACHIVAMQQHMLDKAEICKSHQTIVTDNLTRRS